MPKIVDSVFSRRKDFAIKWHLSLDCLEHPNQQMAVNSKQTIAKRIIQRSSHNLTQKRKISTGYTFDSWTIRSQRHISMSIWAQLACQHFIPFLQEKLGYWKIRISITHLKVLRGFRQGVCSLYVGHYPHLIGAWPENTSMSPVCGALSSLSLVLLRG